MIPLKTPSLIDALLAWLHQAELLRQGLG